MNKPQYPKRLIEVDLPIKRISAHARREKSIRHGHISTLHIWWARRPLAACRAVICAALWPDPANELCPEAFRETARMNMKKWAADNLQLLGAESFKRFQTYRNNPEKLNDNTELRHALLDFIADFANWDNSTKKEYLETSRELTQSAHEALGGAPGTKPLVVDPFAGGGSIPLEALRVGADAFASDLNPVAVLLNKVVLEYIPKYGKRLAEEVRKWGEWIKKEAEKELAEFYPKDPDGATPIAYLWARTIKCEGPGCGAEVPLMRSLWLAKKGSRSIALRIIPNKKQKRVDFEIIENVKEKDVGDGTVKRGSATCPIPTCGYTTPVKSVREQLKARHGGANDARLFCVVTTRPGQQGRFYRLPTERDLKAVQTAAEELKQRKRAHKGTLSLVPDETTPRRDGHRAVASVEIYGLDTWGDLFTFRQLLALTTLVRLVREAGKRCATECEGGLGGAIQTCMAITVDRQSDYSSSLARWHTTRELIAATFGRQVLPMVWDFAEVAVTSRSAGSYAGALEWVSKVCEENLSALPHPAHSQPASATAHPLPDDSAHAFITDPPYYDSVPYADLSDFFYVWLKRSVGNIHADLLRERETPKRTQAIVWHPDSTEEKHEYELKMSMSMDQGRRVLTPWGIGLVVFAHKSTAGWEAQLQAMIDAGWTITASWPIDTEMGSRMNAMGTASLASSIHLVCRPRENPDGSLITDTVGDWRDVLQELPRRIHDWMPRLAEEGVVGADAIFACLGPALEIFSQYARVEKASGEQVTLKEYLEHVWAAVAKEALNMIFEGADASGFEEDARLTAMWLWTLSTNNSELKILNSELEDEDEESKTKNSTFKINNFALEYDAARKIAQGLGAHLEKLAHLVEVKGDKARLLPVAERTKYLFGKDEGKKSGEWSVVSGEKGRAIVKKKDKQMGLFTNNSELKIVNFELGGEDEGTEIKNLKLQIQNYTVLDRIHQSMVLFAAGRGEALKRFLVEDGAGQDQRFWKLAQALSALYPASSDEKRWVDGVMARKKSFGF